MNEIFYFNTPTIHIRFASNFALVKISELLQAKGMNPEVAIKRAQEVFGDEYEKASLYLHNIQGAFSTEVMQKVYEFISHKALFQEPISFSSYDQMIRMMQQVYRPDLREEERRHIQRMAEANHYAIALVR